MSEEYSRADSKQTDFGFGADAQAEDPLRPDSPCPVRSFRMTLSWVGSPVLAPGTTRQHRSKESKNKSMPWSDFSRGIPKHARFFVKYLDFCILDQVFFFFEQPYWGIIDTKTVHIVLFSHWVVSDSLQPHRLQHARLPCPSVSTGVCSNFWPLN